jgi:hypothetical protein
MLIPEWDGTCGNIRRADSPHPSNLAVVEFKRCICAKMGTPNDEVFQGHPLNGKGFRGYCPLRVKNSSWIKDLKSSIRYIAASDPRRGAI